MTGALFWLLLTATLISGARLAARWRHRVAGDAPATARLNERYAVRFSMVIIGVALCLGVLVAVVSMGASEWWPGAAIAGAALAGAVSLILTHRNNSARRHYETFVIGVMSAIASIAVITTFSIFIVLIFEAFRFFEKVPLQDFLFGAAWSPQTAIRADQVASEGAFGVLPLITGTLLVTVIAMAIAAPVGVMSAIYLETYARRRVRDALKLMLELLAGVPTVVYGFFALLVVGPAVSQIAVSLGASFGIQVSVPAQNALAAGLVMGVMIIPFVSSLSDDVMSAIPPNLREGAYALGATKSEAVLKIILPAAAPGLIGAFLLAISRAVGETMIVVMAASRSANLTFNPLERVTTMTVQIVALLTGDQEFDSAKTLAAFALGLLLFLITLALNLIALLAVKQFRMRYE